MIAGLKPYPKYKDSGVEWLGKVPEHWRVRQLSHLGRFSKGNGGTKEDEVPEGVPCIRYGDLYTQHQFFIRQARSRVSAERASNYTPIRYGDILFAASGETIEEIGKSAVNLIESRACCGGDVILLRPTIDLDARFMGYATDCWSAAWQKSCMGRGITVMHIYGSQLKYMRIALPSLPEQTAIVRFIDYVDRRIRRYIRAKQKLIKLLEEQKQVTIHQAVTGQIDVRTGKPYPAYKTSGIEWLGDIPEHWEIVRIKRLARSGRKAFTDGDWIELPYITDHGVRLIQTGNIGLGEYREKGFRYVSEKTLVDLNCTEVVPNDVLICRLDGPVGRACLAPDLGCKAITSVDNTILKTAPEVNPLYVVYSLSPSAWIDWIQSLCRAGGGFRYRVSRSALGNFSIPLPPLVEQHEAANYLNSALQNMNGVISQTRSAISLLREYRTSLIADVLTGKLDVREAAASLPDEPKGSEARDDLLSEIDEPELDAAPVPEETE